jgi:predicted NAD/FAD-dependent oxidoreductase
MARLEKQSGATARSLPTVAVIGSGLTGIACARTLQDAGIPVTLLERSGLAGGRCATRETEVGGFDHGLQYFTEGEGRVATLMAPLLKAGVLQRWNPQCRIADRAAVARFSPDRVMVGVPSANAVTTALSAGLACKFESDVATLARNVEGGWTVAMRKPVSGPLQPESHYDIVLLALAADQALPLLASAPDFAKTASGARSSPVWTLMLAFAEPLDLPFDVALPAEHRMMWLSRESSKPGRRAGERWVLHASVDWSREHLDDDPYRVQEKLLAAFHRVTGTQVHPVYVQVHRWLFGASLRPAAQPALWDPIARIGVAGDWLNRQGFPAQVAGSAQSAMASGIALAGMVLKQVHA